MLARMKMIIGAIADSSRFKGQRRDGGNGHEGPDASDCKNPEQDTCRYQEECSPLAWWSPTEFKGDCDERHDDRDREAVVTGGLG